MERTITNYCKILQSKDSSPNHPESQQAQQQTKRMSQLHLFSAQHENNKINFKHFTQQVGVQVLHLSTACQNAGK